MPVGPRGRQAWLILCNKKVAFLLHKMSRGCALAYKDSAASGGARHMSRGCALGA